MKFSVVIPSFGQAKYLEGAIRTALGQTYENIEVIVVDDGSTDGSLQIAESFGNRIQIIRQVNKGLASARNAGIMNATGDYIFPLDADDLMFNTCIERIADIASTSQADVIAPSLRCFRDGSEEYQDTILKLYPTFDDFKEGNRLPYCSAIYRNALLETGGYSPKMVWGAEDLHLWYDLMTRGKTILTLQEPLVLYRVKENSMWTETKKHEKEFMEQLRKDFPNAPVWDTQQ